jgi:hypothetical protein
MIGLEPYSVPDKLPLRAPTGRGFPGDPFRRSAVEGRTSLPFDVFRPAQEPQFARAVTALRPPAV